MPGQKLRKAARIILIGAPGVGKGTQSERMLKQFTQLSSISSGDLLRDNVRNKTPLGLQAESLMSRGALVPDSMILRLIRNALTTRGWLVPVEGVQPLTLNFSTSTALDPLSITADVPPPPPSENYNINLPSSALSDTEYRFSDEPDASFILDGFPRNATQAEQLERMIPVNLAIHVHTPAEIVIERIANRRMHVPSGRVYNTTFNPPKVEGKDDVTGELLVQREDDKPEVWRARLKTFEESARGLLDHYSRRGVLWKVTGNSSDEITPQIFEEFTRRFGE